MLAALAMGSSNDRRLVLDQALFALTGNIEAKYGSNGRITTTYRETRPGDIAILFGFVHREDESLLPTSEAYPRIYKIKDKVDHTINLWTYPNEQGYTNSIVEEDGKTYLFRTDKVTIFKREIITPLYYR